MKAQVKAVVATVVLSLPIFAFAQSSPTRAQVKSELAQLEKAGYNPMGSDLQYPSNLVAAENQLATNGGNGSAQPHTGYGGTVNTVTQSGSN
ncbi:membrane protein [Caballeronia arvi]|uniref:Membrane protein n=1 Tax=Caballeronia arvi TaxID=1777135 RepID=A0A158J308_9BURK|nr:DUF4148 domain-containing protein [Caballeronia arvi]SAL63238.1 membrane protein [Caballeronia arvi]